MSYLQESHLWQCGPYWLKGSLTLNDADGPNEMSVEYFKQLKANNKKTHYLANTEVKHTIGDLIECERFSSFRRLVRVISYVVRAVKMFNSKRASQSSSPLSTEELSDAEHRWIEDSQGNLE